ncbi:MAG: GH92 family glycosyl hydrolase, partial [Marinilabiliales bacterium]|nr:GH92 family glycosyl hydrolase [Marinilabiliales bacterium]
MKILALLWLGVLATLNLNLCGQTPAPKDYTRLVDPFVGTGEHGHTYPGAVLPFGMVQVSPDTRMANWDGCSGYHHSDSTLLGFSHTHLSGTGAPELCDILLMPTTGAVQFQSGFGSPGNQGYLSTFRHNHEQATPGYYSVFLDKYRIIAELTATERTGFHRYTFPSSSTSNIIIDLKHRGNILESSLSFPDDSTITGHTVTTGWADQKSIYFFARFSKSFERKGIAIHDTLQAGINQASGTNLKAFVGFTTGDQEQVLVKIGLSAVSVEGARKNLMAENPGWDFQSIRESARCKWSRQLSRIEVTGGTDKEQRIFYTALYHTSLAPNLFMDVDSLFRGQDHKVHKAVGFTNYTVFSLWDVFRTQMPMFTLTEPQRMQDFLRSFLSMYQLGGRIPRFEIFGKLSDD